MNIKADLLAGIGAGSVQAALFHPWDRALYLSVRDRRSFLEKGNWSNPFHGLRQTIAHRTVSGGLYFFLQGVTDRFFIENFDVHSPACVGMVAGILNGALLSPISSVKYTYWGRQDASFWKTAAIMLKEDGGRSFFKGAGASIQRDLVFGVCYELMRHTIHRLITLNKMRTSQVQWKHWKPSTDTISFISNCVSAFVATAASAPFNYLRNMKFQTPVGSVPPKAAQVFKELWLQTSEQPTYTAKLNFIHNRFALGWGTARVAAGMGVGQYIFDWIKKLSS